MLDFADGLCRDAECAWVYICWVRTYMCMCSFGGYLKGNATQFKMYSSLCLWSRKVQSPRRTANGFLSELRSKRCTLVLPLKWFFTKHKRLIVCVVSFISKQGSLWSSDIKKIMLNTRKSCRIDWFFAANACSLPAPPYFIITSHLLLFSSLWRWELIDVLINFSLTAIDHRKNFL